MTTSTGGRDSWNDSPLSLSLSRNPTRALDERAFGFHAILASSHHRIIARSHDRISEDSRAVAPAGDASAPHSLRISPTQPASSGELARRNVNTGWPISLIGPIRSNARHSPTLYTVAVRHETAHCTFLNRAIVRSDVSVARAYARTSVRAYERMRDALKKVSPAFRARTRKPG